MLREADLREADLRGVDLSTADLSAAELCDANLCGARLARAELANRHDVFTHDALAWALFADGRREAAALEMRLALAEGTRDARLLLHASLILSESDPARAADLSESARAGAATLMPSEKDLLPALSGKQASAASLSSGNFISGK